MFQNVILQWVFRRCLEIGGILGAIITFYLGLPQPAQEAIQSLLTGHWGDLTLKALVPIAIALWGYIWSFRSTTKPHVTADNTQTSLKKLPPSTVTKVKVDAAIAKQKPSTTPSFGDLLKSIFQK